MQREASKVSFFDFYFFYSSQNLIHKDEEKGGEGVSLTNVIEGIESIGG